MRTRRCCRQAHERGLVESPAQFQAGGGAPAVRGWRSAPSPLNAIGQFTRCEGGCEGVTRTISDRAWRWRWPSCVWEGLVGKGRGGNRAGRGGFEKTTGVRLHWGGARVEGGSR